MSSAKAAAAANGAAHKSPSPRKPAGGKKAGAGTGAAAGSGGGSAGAAGPKAGGKAGAASAAQAQGKAASKAAGGAPGNGGGKAAAAAGAKAKAKARANGMSVATKGEGLGAGARAAMSGVTKAKADLDKLMAASQGKALPPRTMDILQRLKNTKITRDILVKTRVGRTVAKLRKVKDKAVVKLATEIVSAWKRVASAAKSPVVKSKPGKAVKAAKASSKPKPAALSRSVSGLSSASGDSGQPSMASAERVASMLPKHRLAVRNFFRDTLKKYEPQGDTTLSPERAVILANALESNLFSAQCPDGGSVTQAYKTKALSLRFNLSSNKRVLHLLVCGDITARNVVQMSPDELMDPVLRRQRQEEQRRAAESVELDWAERHKDEILEQIGIPKQEGIFKCGVCESRNTTYTQKQTRSADEPMTTFVLCNNCGNRWKFC